MNINITRIEGLYTLTPTIHSDERGLFTELYRRDVFQELFPGIEFSPVQWNISQSLYGVIRGIHAEPWNKLVMVLHGSAFVAITDLRDGSNFGQVFETTLRPFEGVFISKGLGNSFQSLEINTLYSYLVDDLWKEGQSYSEVAYNDPDLAIKWRELQETIVSKKDQRLPTLREAFSDRLPVPNRS